MTVHTINVKRLATVCAIATACISLPVAFMKYEGVSPYEVDNAQDSALRAAAAARGVTSLDLWLERAGKCKPNRKDLSDFDEAAMRTICETAFNEALPKYQETYKDSLDMFRRAAFRASAIIALVPPILIALLILIAPWTLARLRAAASKAVRWLTTS